MNRIASLMIKGISIRGLLLMACVVYLVIQPFAVSAASVPAPGTVTAWGYNGWGQLGNGTTANSWTPVSMMLPSGVTASAVAAGAFHSLAITNDGVYSCGVNTEGELGDGTMTNRTVPVKVKFPFGVTASAIATTGLHTLAITNDGLYAWGYNGSGQVGDGTTINKPTPVKIAFPAPVTTVTGIAAGLYHSLAITNDGLYAWGANTVGQFGNGTFTSSTTPVKAGAFPSVVTNVTAIAAGQDYSLAITNDGLYAWGNNTFGELANGTTLSSNVPVKSSFPAAVTSVSAIAAGELHALAITNDGVYGWGYNNGDLAGTATSITAPVKIAFPKGVTTVTAVAGGAYHSLAITNDGVYAWGSNTVGQLGMTGKNRSTPAKIQGESNATAIAAGYYHSLALH